MVTSSVMSVQLASAAQKALPFSALVGDTPSKLDPADAYDSVSIDVIAQVFEGLYKYDLAGDMSSVPNLASEMGTWSTDMLNLTVKLRPDVVFHDGSPFNASVVKWNFDRLMRFVNDTANTPAVLYVNDVLVWNETINATAKEYELHYQPILKETHVDNNLQVTFVLNKPWAVWEKLLAFSGSFMLKPNAKYDDAFLTTDDVADAIGTGPFKLVSIVPDQKTSFKRYETYRLGKANITDMVYIAIADGDTASNSFLAHEFHYGGVGATYLAQAEADEAITIRRLKSTTVFYLQMNVNNVPIDARKAMSFAFNYTYYVTVTLANLSYQLHTPVPDGMSYHNASIEGLPYLNLTTARGFLLNSADTGIAAGIAAHSLTAASTDNDWIAAANSSTPICDFNFTRYQSTGLDKFAAVMIDSFSKIGIKVTDFVVGDWGTWTTWVTKAENKAAMELSFGGWGPDYNDPINMMEPIYKTGASYNDCEVADSALDTMMAEYYSLTGAAQEQKAWDIQKKIAVEICPTIYLYQRGQTMMYLNEFVSHVDDNLNIFANWYFYRFLYTVEYKFAIPGYSFTPMIISMVVVAAVLILKKRK
jgi:ABC-type transport system substrate-binding protein